MNTTTNGSRYTVSNSAGSKNGKGFAVYDRQERKAVSWHRTFKQAQAAAQKMNRS